MVVQLVRIPACHAGGRGFEPRPLRQHNAPKGAFFLSLIRKERTRALSRKQDKAWAAVLAHIDDRESNVYLPDSHRLI